MLVPRICLRPLASGYLSPSFFPVPVSVHWRRLRRRRQRLDAGRASLTLAVVMEPFIKRIYRIYSKMGAKERGGRTSVAYYLARRHAKRGVVNACNDCRTRLFSDPRERESNPSAFSENFFLLYNTSSNNNGAIVKLRYIAYVYTYTCILWKVWNIII